MKLKEKYITKDSNKRLHNASVPIIGVTGGIGSGKSTVSSILKKLGHFVIDADELVHEIYDLTETKQYLKNICPEAIDDQQEISFSKLREYAFKDPDLLKNLEEFIYKKLPSYFNEKLEKSSAHFVFYDVPLLFEKDLNTKVDMTVTVFVDAETQKQRTMKRDQCTSDIIESIIAKQMPLAQKKDQSDFVIDNSGSLLDLEETINHFLSTITQ